MRAQDYMGTILILGTKTKKERKEPSSAITYGSLKTTSPTQFHMNLSGIFWAKKNLTTKWLGSAGCAFLRHIFWCLTKPIAHSTVDLSIFQLAHIRENIFWNMCNLYGTALTFYWKLPLFKPCNHYSLPVAEETLWLKQPVQLNEYILKVICIFNYLFWYANNLWILFRTNKCNSNGNLFIRWDFMNSRRRSSRAQTRDLPCVTWSTPPFLCLMADLR